MKNLSIITADLASFKALMIKVAMTRIHTRPGKCPGILFGPGKSPGIFKNKDLSWKSPEKNEFASIFFILHYMIDNMISQQNFLVY